MRFAAVWMVLLGLLCGCQSERKKTIAVVPKATSHLFWVSIHAGANAAAKELGVDVLWNGPASETEYSRQIQIVDSLVARRVDGIALAATERKALVQSVDRAVAAGIPVTVFDSGLDSENYMTFVATDNYEAGKMAARTLAKMVGGKGKIGIVMHAPGSLSTMDRERGFQEVIEKEFPNIRIAGTQFGMSERSKAMAAAENILTAHPDLVGLFSSSEPSSFGAALAVKSRQLADKVNLVAFDSSDALVEDLKNGTIDALVVQDPFKIGYEAVRTIVMKLNGETPPKRMDLSATVVQREDLEKPEIRQLLFPDVKKHLQ